MRRWPGLLLVGYLGCQGMHGTPARETATSTTITEAKPPEVVRSAEPPSEGGASARPSTTAAMLEQLAAKRPEQLSYRSQLAELHFANGNWPEAQGDFEDLIGLAQEQDASAFKYLIQGHSRLVEIAETLDDEYAESLNRGIGLFQLARRCSAEPSPENDRAAVPLYCRAADALQDARAEHPEEARPHWYLYQIWNHLGQHTAAMRSLQSADAKAPVSRLTAVERRELQLACLQHADALRNGRR